MKKFLLIIISFLSFIPLVFAQDASSSLSGPSNIDQNSEFTLTFHVNGSNMWGIQGALNYDSSRLTLVGSSGASGFTATVGSNIILDTASAINGNVAAAKLTFRATSTFKPGESTTVSISNIKGSTDSSKFSVSGCSKSIIVNVPKSSNNYLSNLTVDGSKVSGFSKNTKTYNLGNTDKTSIKISAEAEDGKTTISGTGAKNLDYGDNTFNVTATAENGSKNTYTIKIHRNDNRSSNNNLSSLTLSTGNIKFNKITLNYSIVVDNKIDNININATAEDSKSSVSGTGSKKLNVYINTFSIVVTAENGSKKTYKINVSRKDENGNAGSLSKNNNLSSIVIEGYELDFDSSKLDYSLTVDNTVNKLVINANKQDENAELTINNPEELTVGSNTITIVVTAQNGEQKTYTINVTRKDDSPITTIMELAKVMDTTTSKKIVVEIKDDMDTISSEIIKKAKDNKIDLIINKYNNDKLLYTWEINIKKINKEFDFNTYVSFDIANKDSVEKQLNYVDAIYVNYHHDGKLPNNTKFTLYVGDKYQNGDLLNLYYYNDKTGKVELIKSDISVKDGYVNYKINHASTYILTKASLVEEHQVNIFMIISLIETMAIISATAYYFIKTKKLKK